MFEHEFKCEVATSDKNKKTLNILDGRNLHTLVFDIFLNSLNQILTLFIPFESYASISFNALIY